MIYKLNDEETFAEKWGYTVAYGESVENYKCNTCKNTFWNKNFKFCPYCGKKIKYWKKAVTEITPVD